MTPPRCQTIIGYSLRLSDLRQEVYVADETGVQGRFEQAVGQVETKIRDIEHHKTICTAC